METNGVVNVPFPSDLAREMEIRAKKFGMSLPTYLAFIARVNLRRHDQEFVNATRFVFSKYQNALRTLAQ